MAVNGTQPAMLGSLPLELGIYNPTDIDPVNSQWVEESSLPPPCWAGSMVMFGKVQTILPLPLRFSTSVGTDGEGQKYQMETRSVASNSAESQTMS